MLQSAVDALLIPIDVAMWQAKGDTLAQTDDTLSPAGGNAFAEGVVSGEHPRHFILEQAFALN